MISREQLIVVAKEKIAELEQAIVAINSTRRALKENAIEVKSEISCAFGRHLEVLRSRELWLATQVSTVEQAKAGALRRQQDTLCRLLGALATATAYAQQPGADPAHLAASIRAVSDVELRPAETPHVSFRGDSVELRRAAREFGRVEGRALPLETAFSDDAVTLASACLPHMYEDYGAPEHVVLYKTLAGLRQEEPVRLRELPRPQQPSPWLCTYPDDGFASETAAPASRSVSEAGGQSLAHWLASLKVEVEVEDDDLEVLSHHASTVSSPAFTPTAASFAQLFTQVAAAPTADWLLITRDLPASQAKTSPCCGVVSCTTPDAGAVDIENLDLLACIGEKEVDAKEDTGCTEKVDQDELAAVCRANEPCQEYSDCVCDNHCYSPCRPEPITEWLATPTQNGLDHFKLVAAQDPASWLLHVSSRDKNSRPMPGPRPRDLDVVEQEPGTWLLHDASRDKNNKPMAASRPRDFGMESATMIDGARQHIDDIKKSDVAKWLLQGVYIGTQCHDVTTSHDVMTSSDNAAREAVLCGLARVQAMWAEEGRGGQEVNMEQDSAEETGGSEIDIDMDACSKVVSEWLLPASVKLCDSSKRSCNKMSDWSVSEEDDSQWLLRKEASTVNSPPTATVDTFPSFKTKLWFEEWLLINS